MIVPRNRSVDRSAEDPPPPWWRPLHTMQGTSASMTCPKGHHSVLLDHVILPDGTVTGPPGQSGSVVCPHAGCTFHETVTLQDWEP